MAVAQWHYPKSHSHWDRIVSMAEVLRKRVEEGAEIEPVREWFAELLNEIEQLEKEKNSRRNRG